MKSILLVQGADDRKNVSAAGREIKWEMRERSPLFREKQTRNLKKHSGIIILFFQTKRLWIPLRKLLDQEEELKNLRIAVGS